MVWLVVTIMLLVLFQSIGTPQALGAEGQILANVGASDFPLGGADPSAQPLPSVLYGGMMWSVAETRVTPTAQLLGRAIIEVDVVLTNTLATTRLRVSDRMVTLLSTAGDVIGNGLFEDAGTRITLDPGETRSVTLRFKTGIDRDPDPAALSLQIMESNRIAASIPLVGPQSDYEGSVFAAVDSTPTVLEDPEDPQRQIVVEPRAATIGINAGPYRAAVGEELAVVKVMVQRSTSPDTSGYLDTAYWALLADGEAVAPLLVTRTSQPATNADEVTLLFAFPTGADELALVAAVGNPDAATFVVVTPKL